MQRFKKRVKYQKNVHDPNCKKHQKRKLSRICIWQGTLKVQINKNIYKGRKRKSASYNFAFWSLTCWWCNAWKTATGQTNSNSWIIGSDVQQQWILHNNIIIVIIAMIYMKKRKIKLITFLTSNTILSFHIQRSWLLYLAQQSALATVSS